jgi:hypothetical protein
LGDEHPDVHLAYLPDGEDAAEAGMVPVPRPGLPVVRETPTSSAAAAS